MEMERIRPIAESEFEETIRTIESIKIPDLPRIDDSQGKYQETFDEFKRIAFELSDLESKTGVVEHSMQRDNVRNKLVEALGAIRVPELKKAKGEYGNSFYESLRLFYNVLLDWREDLIRKVYSKAGKERNIQDTHV